MASRVQGCNNSFGHACAGAEVSNLSLGYLNFKKTEKIIEIKTHKPMNFRNRVRWISHVVNESCVERGIRSNQSTAGAYVNSWSSM